MKTLKVLIMLSFTIARAQDEISFLPIIQQAIDKDQFEGVILIAKEGEIIFSQSSGFSDKHRLVPMTLQDKFRIASITKSFTAVMVLQLVDKGKLRLDQPLSDLLPHLNIPRAKKITPHHLLLHISGLPKEKDDCYQAKYNLEERIIKTLEEGKPNKFGRFNYSNLDYWLLQLIIEKISNQTWANGLSKQIFEPLDMRSSGIAAKDDTLTVPHFMTYDDRPQVIPDYHIENFGAAGAMYTSVTDLLKFDQALYSNELLSAEMILKLHQNHPDHGYVGYGNWIYDYPYAPGKPRLSERRGGLPGFNGVIIRFIEDHKTLIILSNNEHFNTDTFGQTDSLKEALIIAMDEIE